MFLYGDFALISPASLLQLLCQEQLSVTIEAEHGSSQAILQLHEGMVVLARCDDLVGEEAVYLLITWNRGQFQVLPAPEPPAEITLAASWEMLLLEAARRRDELARQW